MARDIQPRVGPNGSYGSYIAEAPHIDQARLRDLMTQN
jgi:hypothetical protein